VVHLLTVYEEGKKRRKERKGKEGKKQSAHIARGRFAPHNEKYVVLKNTTPTAPTARYVAGRRRTSKENATSIFYAQALVMIPNTQNRGKVRHSSPLI